MQQTPDCKEGRKTDTCSVSDVPCKRGSWFCAYDKDNQSTRNVIGAISNARQTFHRELSVLKAVCDMSPDAFGLRVLG